MALRQRIQRTTETKWTFQVGRRIATTLSIIHSERLTGSTWSQRDYESHFGHSAQTAADYYHHPHLTRNRRIEEDFLAGRSKVSGQAQATQHWPGLTVDLARSILSDLLTTHDMNPYSLSCALRAECSSQDTKNSGAGHDLDGPSNVAIAKFLDGRTTSVPRWFWIAVAKLVGHKVSMNG